ncbi:shikimate dehydrogenase (plasmid) [Bacillus sp. 31A1R]|uniref:Shikimate dehydrogenase (NADP(+)) n=1 Tax=Robertmurraya mangrovi TaxID=3098077 RepID=A0ABU5IUV1_9BACI|nr:shikimate dehydrogenase [Bacillus sp. 31A1R]MDZ5470909.1 shikimate dehydrogenase [Bacillus sp. 31A1R]
MKKLYAVIGDPIGHSMSPAMHNDLFQHYKIDAHYHALHVKSEQLEDAIKGLKAIGISGFNVTIPHKVKIISLLDRVDSLALSIGAVNTVVNEDGQLVGYNTDGSGYLTGIRNELSSLEDKKVLIIGAGGAARAIYFSMADAGIKQIDLTNRTVNKALSLIHDCPYAVQSEALELNETEKQLIEYDIVIQTTSIGMSPERDYIPLSLHNLKTNAFVSDIIYNPLETLFLQNAKEKGASIQNGISMFVHQGALAFQKWTGILPDLDRMKNIVLKQLGGNIC